MGEVRVTALQDIDLDPTGEFLVVLGPSSGKSTLLHIIGDSTCRPPGTSDSATGS